MNEQTYDLVTLESKLKGLKINSDIDKIQLKPHKRIVKHSSNEEGKREAKINIVNGLNSKGESGVEE